MAVLQERDMQPLCALKEGSPADWHQLAKNLLECIIIKSDKKKKLRNAGGNAMLRIEKTAPNQHQREEIKQTSVKQQRTQTSANFTSD